MKHGTIVSATYSGRARFGPFRRMYTHYTYFLLNDYTSERIIAIACAYYFIWCIVCAGACARRSVCCCDVLEVNTFLTPHTMALPLRSDGEHRHTRTRYLARRS